jgi:hypothetical protein
VANGSSFLTRQCNIFPEGIDKSREKCYNKVMRTNVLPNAPLPTINNVIRDLDARQRQLLTYLEDHISELEPGQIVSLLGLHGQNAARLGRLLRDRRALSGESADGIAEAISKVLDELATQVQADL